jgi:hypothetical protein
MKTDKLKKVRLEKSIKKLEDKIKQMEEVTVGKSILQNSWSWICIFIAIYCISPHEYSKGIITYFILFFSSYYVHYLAHQQNTFFTLVHQYHHDHTNWLSHGIQYALELSVPFVFLIMNFLFECECVNKWILLFTTLFYSSVHTINYGMLHINNVHHLHHQHVMTNMGPDICDILFGTKHPDDSIENTNHYIPNIIILTLYIVGLKYLCQNKWVDTLVFSFFYFISGTCFVTYLLTSMYLFYQ